MPRFRYVGDRELPISLSTLGITVEDREPFDVPAHAVMSAEFEPVTDPAAAKAGKPKE